ncbi:MAG: hypothetical protein ACPG4T_04900 [Nannocystaceae bacterium]
MAQTFSIKMMVQTYYARLDDQEFQLKQGPRKTRVPTSSLRHLYVEDEGSMQLMWLSYTAADGKLKRVGVGANAGDDGLKGLVDALVAAHPQIDIRGHERKEAMKILGAMSRKARIALGLSLAVVFMVVLSFIAQFIGGALE